MMNRDFPKDQRDDNLSTDLSHQCTLYLLGELHGQALNSFEQQLRESQQLGDILIAQATLIEQVSKISNNPLVTPIPAIPTEYRWRRIATVITLSACLAWALLSLRPQISLPLETQDVSNGSETEILLIAKIWAGDPNAVATETDFHAIFSENSLLEVEEDAGADTSISWMTVAFAAETDALINGEANDG